MSGFTEIILIENQLREMHGQYQVQLGFSLPNSELQDAYLRLNFEQISLSKLLLIPNLDLAQIACHFSEASLQVIKRLVASKTLAMKQN